MHITDEIFPKRDLLVTAVIEESNPRQDTDVTLQLKISSRMAYRVYDEFNEEIMCNGDCIEKQQDGSFIITVTWPENDWVYGTILSYGKYIEVLDPAYVRENIRCIAQKIAQAHKK